MDKTTYKHLLDVAAGREKADLVITNCKIVDVYSSQIIEGKDIAVCQGKIAGIGSYEGKTTVDGEGMYAAPGFIESHFHIESSYVTPEEIGRLLMPYGTTTMIADPHEIVNVAGLDGLNYMIEAAKHTKLDIKYMMPSCVPASPFEHSGACVQAGDMREMLENHDVFGLGEFMNFPGVIQGNDAVLDKLLLAKENGMIIDGHSPGVSGMALNAYAASGIHTDHECSVAQEAKERVERGMYVMLRQGSACHDLKNLLPAVTKENSRRFILCSDDRQPKTIFEHGDLNHHLTLCVDNGIDAITAIQMATLNAAECYHLYDRGAIAPGLRADIVLLKDLVHFQAEKVWIEGELAAEKGTYLFDVHRCDTTPLQGRFHVKDFSEEKLKAHLKSGSVRAIEIIPGSIITNAADVVIDIDADGDFVFNPQKDIVKMAVIERHHHTGLCSVGFLKGYGMKTGAIALSIAHDSHNIIAAGTNNHDMELCVSELVRQGGGIVLADQGEILCAMPFIVGGIMTDQSGEWVCEHLENIHKTAFERLKVSEAIDPVMTLCFMSLSVIPKLKLTAEGLFDVTQFKYVPLEQSKVSV